MLPRSHRHILHLLNVLFVVQLARSDTFRCVKDGFFPDKDCWIYHICVGNTHSVKACKEELMFNPKKNECDWAINVNCSKKSDKDALPPTTPTHALYPPDFNFPGENGPPDKYPPRYSANVGSIFEQLCQSADNDYVAHPKDCKRYAYCASGLPQAKVCPRGLLWSQTARMCVWPAQSDCPPRNYRPEGSEASSEYGRGLPQRGTPYPTAYILTDKPRVTAAARPYATEIECPSTQSWRLPDPYDCSLYHECFQGVDTVAYCPAQLLYSPDKQTCDYPQEVPCKNKCTAKNEGARFVDLTSCCHFFECVSGKLIPQTCTHPNSFDVQTRTCLPYKRVKCDGRRQCLSKCHYLSNYDVGKSLCDFVPSCAGHSDGFYLDRTKPNCQSYIQCMDNRVANHSRCPMSQRFNRNIGRCAPADQVPCRAPSSFVNVASAYAVLVSVLLLASTTVL